jgi:hypothetical protein
MRIGLYNNTSKNIAELSENDLLNYSPYEIEKTSYDYYKKG